MHGVAEKLGSEQARQAAAGPHLTLRSAHADAPPSVPPEVAVATGIDPSADLTAADLDAIAGAVMERGGSIERIANARGQSVPAMLVAIDKADRDKNSETGGRLDAITRGHETMIRMAISDLKGRALDQLVARIDDINAHPQRHTVQEHRAAEFARRLCFSLLRLDAFCAHHPDRRSSSEPPEPPEPPEGRGPRLTYDARRERERRQRNGHDPSLYWYERGGERANNARLARGDTPGAAALDATESPTTPAPNAPRTHHPAPSPPAPSRFEGGSNSAAGDTPAVAPQSAPERPTTRAPTTPVPAAPAAGTNSARASVRGESPGSGDKESPGVGRGGSGDSGTPTLPWRPSSHSNRGIVPRLTRQRHKPIHPAVNDMAVRPRPP